MSRSDKPSSLKNSQWRGTLPTFLFLAVSLTACLALLIYTHTRDTVRHDMELLMHQQQDHMELAEVLLQQELARISIDLLAFTHTPVIQQFFKNTDEQPSWQRVNQGLSNFIQLREGYDQALVLDTKGRELVRVEKREQETLIIPLQELKTTSQNPSVHEFLRLEARDQIAFSPMELSRDKKGEIRRPFQPVFHLGTPIFDQHNRQAGILIFTCRGQYFFDLFSKATRHNHASDKGQQPDTSQIINQDGYWLLAPDKKDEGGSAHDPQRSFGRRFPEVWKSMLEQGQGQLLTADGLFTFSTMHLAFAGKISSDSSIGATTLGKDAEAKKAPFWILLSQVPQEELNQLNSHRRFHLILFLVILSCSLPLLLWLTQLLQKERRYKERLQFQERGFRQLYDQAPLPYMSLDQDGCILNINQTWLTTLEYTRNEVIGKWFGNFVPPQSLVHFQESFSLFAEKDEMEISEVELVRKEGSTLLASFHSERITDDLGAFSQTNCIFTDITGMRAEEQRTEHLNILLQTFIEIHRLISQERGARDLVNRCCEILTASRGYASAWIVLLDTNGKIETSASSGLLDNFDHLRQQINLGNFPPCIRECRERQGLTVIDSPAIFCTACRTANTYPRTGVMCAALKYDSHPYGYLNVSLPFGFTQDKEDKDLFSEIAQDIGYALFNLDQQQEKIEAESSLRQSKEQLRSITYSAQDAILMMDPQGAISFWNPAAEALLGYRAEDALGKNLHTLLTPSRYHGAQQAAFPGFLRSGHGSFIGKTVEVAALRKDGREIPVALSLSAVLQDEKWHAVGILRDMTEHKLMEERMLQTEKMTIIAGLAAGIAHEINTPLSAILQSIQVIRQSLSPDLARNQDVAGRCGLDLAKVEEYFQKREISFFMDGIRDSAIKSAKIIANLLQFSRPQKLESSRTDLALLLDNSVDLAKNDYELKKKYDILNVDFVREYTPGLPQVSCVAMEIEQVFINLLKNAAQAMADRPEPRPSPRIILRTLQHQEMVRVEIEDNGPGMDEETRLHIFNPFFTTKDIGIGTGLGLSVSYTIIVTKHTGALTVHSKPGQGTTMTIDLPVNAGRDN